MAALLETARGIVQSVVGPGDLSQRRYVRWDQPGIEDMPPTEGQDIKALVDDINESQRRFYEKNNHCFGATHARTQGIVKGKFVVPDDLPAYLKQTELFERGGEYPAVCRYSSEPGDPKLDDRIAQPRGLGLKLFNVQGDMFDPGRDFPTQDIEFNSTPALDLADAKVTKEIFNLRLRYADDPDELRRHIEARDDTELQVARNKVDNIHLESINYYSQTAYRFGDFVIKYRLTPSTKAQNGRGGEAVDDKKHPDGVLHDWLRDYYRDNDAEYLFQVQLLENIHEQPVEYAGTEWDATKYPWQTVARLVIPRQETWNEERNRFWVNNIRLDPWHGLVKLQPLGGANRLRRVVYPASAVYRRKLNGEKEVNVVSPSEIPGF